MIWKNKSTYKENYKFVKNNRFIGPNLGFIKQLLIFEKKLKDSDYDLDKVDLSDVIWPQEEGFSLSFADI